MISENGSSADGMAPRCVAGRASTLVRLERADLGQAPHVALGAGEAGAHERPGERHRHLGGDDVGAQAEDVGVVVLARLPGREEIVAERGPHSANLVGGDRHSGAAPADQDAGIRPRAFRTARTTFAFSAPATRKMTLAALFSTG